MEVKDLMDQKEVEVDGVVFRIINLDWPEEKKDKSLRIKIAPDVEGGEWDECTVPLYDANKYPLEKSIKDMIEGMKKDSAYNKDKEIHGIFVIRDENTIGLLLMYEFVFDTAKYLKEEIWENLN